MGKRKPSAPWLRRKAKQEFRGYPIATVAFYGPTAELATKVVVSIVRDEGHEPDPLERWFSEDVDVRANPAVGEKVLAWGYTYRSLHQRCLQMEKPQLDWRAFEKKIVTLAPERYGHQRKRLIKTYPSAPATGRRPGLATPPPGAKKGSRKRKKDSEEDKEKERIGRGKAQTRRESLLR